MATFFCNAKIVKSGKAASSLSYICATHKYAKKIDEVLAVGAGNLPSFAANAQEFFKLADEHEKEKNAQVCKSLIIAIPHECEDKKKWVAELVKKICVDQAYAYAIHNLQKNPHVHLLFSERTNNKNLDAKTYFSRKNKKLRTLSKKSWLEDTKKTYLKHIRSVCPHYTPAGTGGEEPQHNQFFAKKIEAQRSVRTIKNLKNELENVNLQILQNKPGPNIAKFRAAYAAPAVLEAIIRRPRL